MQYQIVIIGGGSAGIAAARAASGFGARVLLVDKHPLGGEALHYGSVPMKAMLRSAAVAQLCRRAESFGVRVRDVQVDMQKVMERRHVLQKRIAEQDSIAALRALGVEVLFGQGRFVAAHEFRIGDRIITSENFIIATGSRPADMAVPGLRESAHHTTETILGMLDMPQRLFVLGAGSSGVEYAQLMQRLGSHVIVLEKEPHILPHEDPELADQLEAMLRAEGVDIHTNCEVTSVERNKQGVRVHAQVGGSDEVFLADQLLVALSRLPNVEGLGLEHVGVRIGSTGIDVDEQLRTTTRHIFAIGEVCGNMPPHAAEFQAEMAVFNALFSPMYHSSRYPAMPRVTSTDPELAQVGMIESEARAASHSIIVLRHHFNQVDRALIEGRAKGMVKMCVNPKGFILGAGILGAHAGDLLAEVALAMRCGLKVQDIAGTVHAYPTLSRAVWRAAREWYHVEGHEHGVLGSLKRLWVKKGRLFDDE